MVSRASAQAGPHLTARALRPVLAGARELGLADSELAAEAGIAPSALADPEGAVPHAAVGRLWRALERASGDSEIGHRVALAAPLDAFDLHGYALRASATLREAFRRAARYQRLIHSRNALVFAEDGEPAVLRHAPPGGLPVARHPAEFLLTAWLRIGRDLVAEPWSPRWARVAHGEVGPAFAGWVDAPVVTSAGVTALAVANAWLDRPNPRADRALAELLDRFAGALLAALPVSHSTADRVRHWLEHHLADGPPATRAAARDLATSERSLQRALAAEGVSFGVLVETLRRERAAELLQRSRASLAEIAFLLGFAETSSFFRAYRRWTGRTPAAARAALGPARADNEIGGPGQ
jgi:AraC-like DNA-binding protein